MYCRICIKGRLDHSWQEWFGNLQIKHDVSDTTVLEGELCDQAALYGVFMTIRQLGLTLLSLETLLSDSCFVPGVAREVESQELPSQE